MEPIAPLPRRIAQRRIAFLLVPDFSMIAFTTAVEPLRVANRVLGDRVYDWTVLSVSGAPVSASNGVSVMVDGALPSHPPHVPPRPDLVMVCAGLNVAAAADRMLLQALRRWHHADVALGGVCTGTWLLAEAGLLEDVRCVIHWEALPAFAERFPDADVRADLYQSDRGFLTCAGGTAPLDMMLHMVAEDLGDDVVSGACQQIITDRVRQHGESQTLPIGSRLKIANGRLLEMVRLMETNISEPLSLEDIAAAVKLSRRQVERLYQRHLGMSPARCYTLLRLNRAHLLLTQSDLPVLQVALACGFVSASHFSKCYRAVYGRPPARDRMGQGTFETGLAAPADRPLKMA